MHRSDRKFYSFFEESNYLFGNDSSQYIHGIQRENQNLKNVFRIIAIIETSHYLINYVGSDVVFIFLYFKRLFKCIDHFILFGKLYSFGKHGKAMQHYKSYLAKRQQKVSLEVLKSYNFLIRLGVPKVFFIGYLKFLIYINTNPSYPFF